MNTTLLYNADSCNIEYLAHIILLEKSITFKWRSLGTFQFQVQYSPIPSSFVSDSTRIVGSFQCIPSGVCWYSCFALDTSMDVDHFIGLMYIYYAKYQCSSGDTIETY